ncbi:hypothetical protein [Demequina sp.]|uniref:hypothetical protein n=1 Tax=Demequina sp. TaxID=2050685 RepID=UPI0025B7C8B7|nr:hypothetical protein [Demequina sp.]
MDLPILGTIDLTPTGVFLFLAAALAVVYFGRQLFGVGRAGRDAPQQEEPTQVESADDAGTVEADEAVGEGADDADGSHKP